MRSGDVYETNKNDKETIQKGVIAGIDTVGHAQPCRAYLSDCYCSGAVARYGKRERCADRSDEATSNESLW